MEFSVDGHDFNGHQDLGLSRMVLALGLHSPLCFQKVKRGIWLERSMFDTNAHVTPKSQGDKEGSGGHGLGSPTSQ